MNHDFVPKSLKREFLFSSVFSLIMFFILILSAFFLSYTRRTLVQGQIELSTSSYLVHPSQRGVISTLNVTVGQHVLRGQILLQVTADHGSNGKKEIGRAISKEILSQISSIEIQEKNLKNKIDNQRTDLNLKVFSAKNDVLATKNSIIIVNNQILISRNIINRLNVLRSNNLATLTQVDTQLYSLLNDTNKKEDLYKSLREYEIQLNILKNQISSLDESYIDQYQLLEKNKYQLLQYLDQNESQISYSIYSDVDGFISSIGYKKGEWVETSNSVLSIQSNKNYKEVDLYLPSKAVGFVSIGQKVELELDSFPSEKFGTLSAVISSISASPVEPTSISHAPPFLAGSRENYYVIRATLNSETIFAFGPHSLEEGMLVKAYILSEKRKLWEWAIDPLLNLMLKK